MKSAVVSAPFVLAEGERRLGRPSINLLGTRWYLAERVVERWPSVRSRCWCSTYLRRKAVAAPAPLEAVEAAVLGALLNRRVLGGIRGRAR